MKLAFCDKCGDEIRTYWAVTVQQMGFSGTEEWEIGFGDIHPPEGIMIMPTRYEFAVCPDCSQPIIKMIRSDFNSQSSPEAYTFWEDAARRDRNLKG